VEVNHNGRRVETGVHVSPLSAPESRDADAEPDVGVSGGFSARRSADERMRQELGHRGARESAMVVPDHVARDVRVAGARRVLVE